MLSNSLQQQKLYNNGYSMKWPIKWGHLVKVQRLWLRWDLNHGHLVSVLAALPQLKQKNFPDFLVFLQNNLFISKTGHKKNTKTNNYILLTRFFFEKNGPIPASFCLFSLFSHYNFNNWKKNRWCAWESNPGPHDGRRRRNHGAMAGTLLTFNKC